MGDFHQSGPFTTLHQLRARSIDELENDLLHFRETCPMALVLPCHAADLHAPALLEIISELSHVPYLNRIIVGLDQASASDYRHALQLFGKLPQQNTAILWNDGPRLKALFAQIPQLDPTHSQTGKGRNVWTLFGYLLATHDCTAIAIHDCDILSYDRSLLARLLYPIASPHLSYQFCKGYYPRISEGSLYGRVSRLLVTPLLRTLHKIYGPHELLSYLDAFRYLLAGEFALTQNLLPELSIPPDWALEVDLLAQLHRQLPLAHICQADLAECYDHKHQTLTHHDGHGGLSKMSLDISLSLIRKMADEGEVFNLEHFRTIKSVYSRIAYELLQSYHDDALINGLTFQREIEASLIDAFADTLLTAGDTFLNQNATPPKLPTWRVIQDAIPTIFIQLREAVALDLREV